MSPGFEVIPYGVLDVDVDIDVVVAVGKLYVQSVTVAGGVVKLGLGLHYCSHMNFDSAFEGIAAATQLDYLAEHEKVVAAAGAELKDNSGTAGGLE